MIVTMDVFDEIDSNFWYKVFALINELLDKGTKVLIISRPQDEDIIINALDVNFKIVHFKIDDD
jgi:hypothetical protein